jgi:hypothetical protein
VIIIMCRLTCADSSLCDSDDDEDVARPTKRLKLCPQIPAVHLVNRKIAGSTAEHHNIPSSVQDLDPKIYAEDSNSDDDDELSHTPSWYRFGPSTAIIESSSDIPLARHRYIALVEDHFRDREFHRIIGKEYIDGKVHYMVDWIPSLVRGSVLHKAKAQPLISQFEASCEAQRRKKKRAGAHRSNGSGTTDRVRGNRQIRTRHMLRGAN